MALKWDWKAKVPPSQLDEVAIERALYNIGHDLDQIELTRPEMVEVVRRAAQWEVSHRQVQEYLNVNGSIFSELVREARRGIA